MNNFKLPSRVDRFAVYDPKENKLRGPTEAELAAASGLSDKPSAQSQGKVGMGQPNPPATVALKSGELLFNTRTHYYNTPSGEVQPVVWTELRELMRLRGDIDYLARELAQLKQQLAEKESSNTQNRL